jgi:hypothetical protein
VVGEGSVGVGGVDGWGGGGGGSGGGGGHFWWREEGLGNI